MRAWMIVALLGCSAPPPAADAGTDAVIADAPAPIDAAPIDARSGECDPIAQDCPGGDKCTYVLPPADLPFRVACVAPEGSVAVGEPCTRSAAGPGHDDCADGFCSFIGGTPPDRGGTRRCRALCAADADCPGSERCALVTREHGICGPPCTAFGADCDADHTCADAWPAPGGGQLLVCRVLGTTALGGSCTEDEECVADAVCILDACRPLCDAAHPCTTGECRLGDATTGACL